MNVQTSNAVSFIGTQLRTTLATINADVGNIPETLAADLIPAGLLPTGPMMFIYDGVTMDPDHEFDLRIGLPVSLEDAARYKGKHLVQRLEPFQFVETVLYGDIAKLGEEAYEPLFTEMGKAGLAPNGFGREVYQNFVDLTSPDNETRVQVGVAA